MKITEDTQRKAFTDDQIKKKDFETLVKDIIEVEKKK